MFDEKDLRELIEYQAGSSVLSVYLNVDPTQRSSDEYKLSLRHMIKEVNGQANPDDVNAIMKFFDHEYDGSGRSVVLFTCAAEDFWRSYKLQVPVSSGVTLARKPYVSPLAALMDTYGRYVVALADRQGVRLYLFHMGELVETDGYMGEEVRKVKKGRGSSAAGRKGGEPQVSSRHEEEVVHRNVKGAVEATARFWRRTDPDRLIVAGADPNTALFKAELPKALQERLIGTFTADMNASEQEIREQSFAVLKEAEDARESALVEAMFTAAAKGSNGVVRLDDTLSASREGRIQTLVIDRHFHAPGYQCNQCGYITAQRLETCPFCGGKFEEISDAPEALVSQVIENGGNVVVVDEHPRLQEAGVGGILRY